MKWLSWKPLAAPDAVCLHGNIVPSSLLLGRPVSIALGRTDSPWGKCHAECPSLSNHEAQSLISTTKESLQEEGLSVERHQVPPKLHSLSSCLLLSRSTGDGGDLLVGNGVAVAFQGAGSKYFLKPISKWTLRACKET